MSVSLNLVKVLYCTVLVHTRIYEYFHVWNDTYVIFIFQYLFSVKFQVSKRMFACQLLIILQLHSRHFRDHYLK